MSSLMLMIFYIFSLSSSWCLQHISNMYYREETWVRSAAVQKLMKFNLFKHLMHSMWFQFLPTLKHTLQQGYKQSSSGGLRPIHSHPLQIVTHYCCCCGFSFRKLITFSELFRIYSFPRALLPTPTLLSFTLRQALSYQKAIWSCFRRQFT